MTISDEKIQLIDEMQAVKIQAETFEASESLVDSTQSDKKNEALKVVEFVKKNGELFIDSNGTPYFLQKDVGQNLKIGSSNFKKSISSLYFLDTGKIVREQSFNDAIQTLSGLATHSKKSYKIFTRTAFEDNIYWLDMAEPQTSRAIKISEDGWSVVDKPPVRFTRSESMYSIPEPTKDGDFNLFWGLANIPKNFHLLVTTWLIESLRPQTPYPVLELFGEQGSAKSSTTSYLRRLIDPNRADLRSVPKKEEDIFVSANQSLIQAYENVSYLHPNTQDVFCKLSTGAGYAKRKNYSDADEYVIEAKRPIIINGITPTITAQDLIDRTISIELPRITNRLEVDGLEAEFKDKHSSMLGGLLNITVAALRLVKSIEIPSYKRPRLLEFAKLGIAVEKVLVYEDGSFLHLFQENRRDTVSRTIDASPVASALMDWFSSKLHTEYQVTTSLKKLYQELESYKPFGQENWPRTEKGLGDALRRVAPALRIMGIECRSIGKHGGYVLWSFSKIDSENIKLSIQCPASPDVLNLSSASGHQDLQDMDSTININLKSHNDGSQFAEAEL